MLVKSFINKLNFADLLECLYNEKRNLFYSSLFWLYNKHDMIFL